jgi:hypothetical protein
VLFDCCYSVHCCWVVEMDIAYCFCGCVKETAESRKVEVYTWEEMKMVLLVVDGKDILLFSVRDTKSKLKLIN